MENKYLIVNRGSASEKYAVYTKEKCLAFLHLEKTDQCNDFVSTLYINNNKVEECITKKEFNNSLNYALGLFIKNGVLVDKKEIIGIGIRIVAPGEYFQKDKIIDKIYEKEIKKVIQDAPLHILPTYEAIRDLRKMFKSVSIIGVSDSSFHITSPAKAKYYAIPFSDSEENRIQRFGYHGISVKSVINSLQVSQDRLPERIIVCHIGGGVSLTAIKDGQSVENSMGFTPLEGAMMATRGGDIDPGAIAFLSDNLGLRGQKLVNYLNKNCGLLGVSGKSSDIRDLIKLESEGEARAKLALEMFVYRIQKYIGAYFVVLGGLDTIIFTATVGERSFIIRERICNGLESLGVKIDKTVNNQSEGVEADISAPDSLIKVLVRITSEMDQIAREAIALLG